MSMATIAWNRVVVAFFREDMCFLVCHSLKLVHFTQLCSLPDPCSYLYI